jgi:hypothetical protein
MILHKAVDRRQSMTAPRSCCLPIQAIRPIRQVLEAEEREYDECRSSSSQEEALHDDLGREYDHQLDGIRKYAVETHGDATIPLDDRLQEPLPREDERIQDPQTPCSGRGGQADETENFAQDQACATLLADAGGKHQIQAGARQEGE